MKWAARVLSVVLTVVWLAVTLFVLTVPEDPTPPSGWLLLALTLIASAGLLLGWRRPRVGGGIAIGAGVACVLTRLIGDVAPTEMLGFVALLIAGPFVLTGTLFMSIGQPQANATSRAALLTVFIVAMVTALLALVLGLGVRS